MAAKRGATSELNHDNWNQEDEPEERGEFKRASEDALKTRVIRTAKRRNPIRTEEDGNKKSAFVGFTGFGSKSPSNDFSFLKDLSKTDNASKTNGISKPEETKSTDVGNIFNISKSNTNIFGAPVSASSANIFGSSASTTTTSSNLVPSLNANGKTEKYCSKLKGLNESVSKWIVKKVEENPFISLQPIFKDYEKYLDEIEKEEKQSSEKIEEKSDKKEESSKAVPTFNFNPAADKNTKAMPDSTSKESTNKETVIPTFKFGAPASTSAATTEASSVAPTFTFGSANNANSGGSKTFSSLTSASTVSGGFSFGSNTSGSAGGFTFPTSTGFSFGGVKKPESETPKEGGTEETNENDEDEPPKVEFKPVVEKDHLYTIKCKVFVKNEDRFSDRGVGNLYLKPIENSEKVQLIVRADTNLGNLLLNLILSEAIPTKRIGKKDVMLVAIPTPDAKPPPTPILVRVKSPEEADGLLEVLEKHKK
ncbi:nuclear pore complex protein Nup50 [Anthonomus grandis grandis]|uniref:nuclear pore complex protein Nup50 n=1 Tax=Anthonomus grandis grandis TaxID=2921223 RepID=UPI0021654073|nr:nuclear pore complex protein Nup50 [Anthonomus grandis grandis]